MGVIKGVRFLLRRGETARRPRERYAASDPSVRTAIAAATEDIVSPAVWDRSQVTSHRAKSGSRRKRRYT
jgi:hypothetical protein